VAIGGVTALGASEARVAGLAPRSAAVPTAEMIAVGAPTASASAMGNSMPQNPTQVAPQRQARATVAGPSKKCTDRAPAK
jgi:hypothetical protein